MISLKFRLLPRARVVASVRSISAYSGSIKLQSGSVKTEDESIEEVPEEASVSVMRNFGSSSFSSSGTVGDPDRSRERASEWWLSAPFNGEVELRQGKSPSG